MRVHVAQSFVASVVRLEGRSGADAKRAAFDFLTDPGRPGLHLHRLVHAVDRGFWSFRAGRDLRVILHRSGDDVVLCWADRHDRAYAWAAHRVWNGAGLAPAIELEAPPRAAAPALAAVEPPAGAQASRDGYRPRSRRGDRMRRRAVAPLAPVAPPGAVAPGAPRPLADLLRAVREARGERAVAAPPPSPRPRPPARLAHSSRWRWSRSPRSRS